MAIFLIPLLAFYVAYRYLGKMEGMGIVYAGGVGVGAVNLVLVAFVVYASCIEKDEREEGKPADKKSGKSD